MSDTVVLEKLESGAVISAMIALIDKPDVTSRQRLVVLLPVNHAEFDTSFVIAGRLQSYDISNIEMKTALDDGLAILIKDNQGQSWYFHVGEVYAILAHMQVEYVYDNQGKKLSLPLHELLKMSFLVELRNESLMNYGDFRYVLRTNNVEMSEFIPNLKELFLEDEVFAQLFVACTKDPSKSE